MARLNDFPTAAESIESLKRRFIRQNREIARANSTQSLRIRNLESEVSRLLAENVALREEVIAANQELENFQRNGQLGSEIDNLKSKLDAKLAEFGSLIADLGSLPRRRGLAAKPKQRPIDGGFQISPEAVRRRSLMKAARETTDEGRLPAIAEDKFYPRLTLESEDFPELVSSERGENDSPDTASTPIPQPTIPKVVGSSGDEEPSMIFRANENPIQPSPSISNLGARRRKRDSSLINSTQSSEMESKEQDFVPIHISKSGSKRKLSVRDDEDLMSQGFNDHDDFQYTRLAGPSDYSSRGPDAEPEGTPTKARAEKPETQRMEKATVRRALGPKSTNVKQRSSSPTKKSSGAGGWEKEIPKPNPKPPKNRSRDGIDKSIRAVPTSATKQTTSDVVEINLLPEQLPVEENKDTAARLSVGQGVADSSETRIETKDTPPPPMSGTSRPSRRSRGSISYAEPNLRDKMRRPTKEFVDAVSGDARFRRSSKSDLDMAKESCIEANSHDCDVSSMAYNDSCSSTLGGNDENLGLASNVLTDGKRQTLPANRFNFVSALETRPSATSVAMSTLLAGSKRRNHRESRISENSAGYEQDGVLGNGPTRSRRHSSNPATIGASSRSRRSQSSTTFSKETATDVPAVSNNRNDDCHQRASSTTTSSSSSSSNPRAKKDTSEFDYDAFLDSQEGVSEDKRVQRLAASRRRSMML
ncbi:hypothetical protein AJ78_00767 [Emergomyces pasteurianus Ep9510]|uniref:Shugoshin C-terminal domain-containing protein n=1 Tax=Emergomyces pasteurianus Ep9510 TaxID=1447872 RepID=A0A1J9QVD3_9EURO|nr:hypothetical protein AJ78_00767 [Emergomyces pasteurianus Ep9510]